MKTINFPYLALALGLFLSFVVTRGSQTGIDGETALPLLTLLIVNECAFILTLAGVFVGFKQLKAIKFKVKTQPLYAITVLLCILLTGQFVLLGIKLWPL